MNSISITWNGHSCFTVEKDGFSIVFDPYGPNTVPGLAPLSLTADMVLCSHEHSDHGYTDAVTLKHSGTKNPFSITKIDTWHDPEQGALRGPNRIHILESDGLKIAHMGRSVSSYQRTKGSVKASRRDPDPGRRLLHHRRCSGKSSGR